MNNSAGQGGCYPRRPKAEVDNTLRDLQNSSYPTKAEFNNCFIIHSKYFLLLKGVSPLRSLFFRSPNIAQPCPRIFSVNGSIICSRLHFWEQLVMVNYACGFHHSETGKYFEWIIIENIKRHFFFSLQATCLRFKMASIEKMRFSS